MARRTHIQKQLQEVTTITEVDSKKDNTITSGRQTRRQNSERSIDSDNDEKRKRYLQKESKARHLDTTTNKSASRAHKKGQPSKFISCQLGPTTSFPYGESVCE